MKWFWDFSKDHPYVQNMYNFSVKQLQILPCSHTPPPRFSLVPPPPTEDTDDLHAMLVKQQFQVGISKWQLEPS